MTGNRRIWSVGLALGLGLNLVGCAGTREGLIEATPGREGVVSRVLAWRSRLDSKVALPASEGDRAETAAATTKAVAAAASRNPLGKSRLAKYLPGLALGGKDDSAQDDFVQPAGRDLWADAARQGTRERLDRWRGMARQAPKGKDAETILPVAMEIGTDHTTVRLRSMPTPSRPRPRVSAAPLVRGEGSGSALSAPLTDASALPALIENSNESNPGVTRTSGGAIDPEPDSSELALPTDTPPAPDPPDPIPAPVSLPVPAPVRAAAPLSPISSPAPEPQKSVPDVPPASAPELEDSPAAVPESMPETKEDEREPAAEIGPPAPAASSTPRATWKPAPASVESEVPSPIAPAMTTPLVPTKSLHPVVPPTPTPPAKVAPVATVKSRSRLRQAWNALVHSQAGTPIRVQPRPVPAPEPPLTVAAHPVGGGKNRSLPVRSPRDQLFPATYYSVPFTADVPFARPEPPTALVVATAPTEKTATAPTAVTPSPGRRPRSLSRLLARLSNAGKAARNPAAQAPPQTLDPLALPASATSGRVRIDVPAGVESSALHGPF